MGTIDYEAVTKIYNQGQSDEELAVDEIDLAIEDGEFLVLVGPSGCGKTTTLRCLAGLEEVTSGTIRLDGADITDQTPRERDIAMVFQNYALYPHMTVQQNLAFPLKYTTDYSSDKIESEVKDTASMLGIAEFLDNTPGQLSGGQQQRVALGRAIIRQPKAFLFDEPLSNLDAKLRREMRAEIIRLQRELNVTSLYVTHDQEEAMTMGDRIAVMEDGELQQLGSPNQVYNKPANEFVASFIGSPEMNFLPLVAQSQNDTVQLVSPDEDNPFRLPIPKPHWPDGPPEAGTPITLGIRPEDVRVLIVDEDQQEGEVYEGIVDVVEPLGSDNLLHVYVGTHAWILRTSADYFPTEDEPIRFQLDLENLHLFGPDSDRITLEHPSEPESEETQKQPA